MRNFLLLLAVIVAGLVQTVSAQTTLTTLPNPPYNASNGAGANAAVTFVIENTNAYPIVLNGVSTWLETTDANSTLQLWYSSSSLSGAPTIASPAWTQIAQVTNFAAPATNGITPVWNALNFTIPAGAQYRFAVWYVNTASHYSGTGVGTVAPSVFSGGGVNLKLGDTQIGGAYVGYGGVNNPRWWTGAITFQPAGPCTNPPTAGNVVSSSNPACSGSSFTVSLSGGTGGTGQTYQWQTSPDGTTWTNVPAASGGTNASLTTSQTSNTYYRATVTCGSGSSTSAALLVTTNICYCPSVPTNTADEEIYSVSVNGATNVSSCTVAAPGPGSILNRYSNFYPLGSLTTIQPGSTVPFTVVEDECDGATYYNNGIAIWIDFNRDGDFDDIGEQVFVENATSVSPKTVTGTFTVPVGATPGITGMRVIAAEGYSGAGLIPCLAYGYGETEDYLVTIGVPPPCTNPPTTGTINSTSPNPVCVNTPFTLYTTGGSFGTGQTYQWQSSPDGTTWTNVAGATASTLNTSVTADTYFRIQVTCGATVSSASYQVTTQLCYCASGATNTADEEIYSITVNGATNTSSCTVAAPGPGSVLNRYSNFRPLGSLTTLIPGTSVPFTIVEDECDGPTYYNHGAAIWIDFNRDGDFTDAGEQVFVESATSMGPRTITGTIAIPATAVPGITVMRITVAENYSGAGLTPCLSYGYGETEDYNVTIIPPIPCAGIPTGGTATTTKAFVCLGENFTLNTTGSTQAVGLTYQWQSSPDGTTWTNIAGATNSSLTTNQSVTTYYRLAITCTNAGGGTGYSSSVVVTSPPLVSGTYTINSAAPTGGGNFNSFNDAYNFIKCGINGPVIFNVNASSGPYNEQLILNAVPGASATNTITFNGNGRTITFNTTSTAQNAVIKLDNADYFTFNNLVITSTGTSNGFGVQLINNADYNTINGCTINVSTTATGTGFAGIVMTSSHTSATTTGSANLDNNIISNNTVNGGYYGITLVGSSTVANGNNQIIGNNVKDFYSYGIYVSGSFNALVQGNTISRPTRATVTTFYGIYFTGLSASAQVNKNRITNAFGGAATSTSVSYGIYFTGVDALSGLENIVSNNLMHTFNGLGDHYGIYNSSSDNVWYFHNTIAFDHTTNTGTTPTRGFYQTLQADGIVFMNNIITITRGGTGVKHALYFATATSDILSNRNDLYVASAGGNNNVGNFNNINYPLLPAWRAATGDDINSISADPIYTNPATGDYKPTNASIDNRGVYVDIVDDIMNVARNTTTPDVGAYEFTPPPCIAPPVGGTATVSQTPICVNFPVILSATGNSSGLTQTYQWQTATAAAGPWTNFGTALTAPDTVINASSTLYYRLGVTCGVSTTYSTAVLLTVTPALPAGTYTINKNVATGGTNYNSFNAAKAAMSCGIAGPVVFNVVPGSGPYNEQLILDSIPGTSVVNTVTFNGNGDSLKYSSTVTDERAVIKLNSADHIIFDSLVIDARHPATGTTYGYGVQLINNADSNVFRKCTILASPTSTSTNYVGIVISASATSATTTGFNSRSDYNLFDRNTVIGGYYGATIVGGTATTDPRINGNMFTNNTIRDFYFYGMYVSGTINTLIEANNISRPTRTNTAPSSISSFYGIYFTGVSSRASVTRNRIHTPFGGVPTSTSDMYAIYFTAADATTGNENRVTNNLVYNMNGAGLVYAFYNSSSDYVLYYHNTISLDNTTSTSTSATRGFYQITSASGIQFRNNIVSIRRGGTGTKHVMYFATSTSEIYADRNDYYLNAPGTQNYIGYYNANIATIAEWRTVTLQDGNTKTIDPDYTNPAAGDYKPGFGAAGIDNLGTPVGVTVDILNAARSLTTPDPGAYEFNIPPCVTPPVAGTTNAVPNSNICMGTPIALSLTGNTVGAGQTYTWQSGPSSTGPWTDMGPAQTSPFYTATATFTTYYRAAIQCNAGPVVYSTPVLVTLNPPLAAGTYTIDPSLPVSATNFTSFTTAVNALYCGIAGHVIFNAAPVAFNEQVRVGVVPGTSPSATVTFQTSPASATMASLQFSATSTDNYTLRFDSVQYVFFKRLTINAQSNTNGRAVEFAKIASNDSLVNCIINVPPTTTTTNAVAGVYADALTGGNNTIKGNTINGGTSGIYFAGTDAATLTSGNNIEGNTITGSYQNGIYTSFTDRTKVNKNTVTLNGTSGLSTTSYGIYVNNADTAFQVAENKVTISNSNTAVYGIYLNVSDATVVYPGKVANNMITAVTANSGNLYGLALNNSSFANVVNNVVSVQTNGTTSYGLWSNLAPQNKYYNNSINSTSTGTATTNVAAYFNHTSGASGNVNIRNNIFSHKGGGRAMTFTNANYLYSDYNMLYSSGTTLVSVGATNYATLNAFQNAWTWDVNSIVYNPAFTSNTDLRPDLTSPNVWAIHGRGVQIPGNDYDFNNSPRPTTLTAGVPDLGAYEFLPTSTPVALTATPAAPVANAVQTFMLGTDTVAKISWGATVPASITGRRYSGVLPPSLPAGAKAMYFYTDFDVPGTNNYPYTIRQNYIDPWQGFIPVENQTRLGRTDASNNWIVSTNSSVDEITNVITEPGLSFIDKFTGMADPLAPPPPPIYVQTGDSSNRGTNFWVPYGHHMFFESDNSQQMVLYLSAEQAANVTVRIAGTPWVKTYAIPANTVITSDLIPKTGIYNARILGEGLYSRGINITSDVPIVAYAHIYGSASSGATMLMPVGVYGYDYHSLNSMQNYATTTFSWVNVVAAYDSTVVEITPAVPTRGGRVPGVPFTVTLNKGDVYQLLGSLQSGSVGYDMSGTRARSISNASGKCYPFAMFSGSSRTYITCSGAAGNGGDNIIQQNFPTQAWGTKYITAPTSNGSAANSLMTNIYRILVKDPTTVITRNGAPVTGLINNRYYQFSSNTADYIVANAPIMVSQYMASNGGCAGVETATGDPEMIYLSPLEQAIKKVGFYRTTLEDIDWNYLTLVIPTAGVASLTINGSSTFDYTYAITNRPGYTAVVKRWAAAPAQVLVQSDSAFTAVTYGLGSVESYGYNAGTLVKNLLAQSTIQNTLATPGVSAPFTCPNAPFRFTTILAVKPTQLLWKFSAMSNLSPNADVTQVNPTAIDSFLVNGRWFYKFTVPADYTFSTVGRYLVPIYFTHPSVENCNNTQEATVIVDVVPGPKSDFSVTYSGCVGDMAQLNASTTAGTFTINRWQWNFGDATTSNIQSPTKTWSTPGTYNVSLRVISPEGCFGDTIKPVVVNPLPVAAVAVDSIAICSGQSTTFNATVSPGFTYRWYSAATGGTLLSSTATLNTGILTTTTAYYLEVTNGTTTCTSARKRVVAQVYNKLATPVVVTDTVGVYMARWRWNAVPGATAYEVSRDGVTWTPPSSGTTGLTHTITGLQPVTTYNLQVRALGVISCQTSTAGQSDTTTLTDMIFIPNTFTPNADGKNDVWRVYGNVITSAQVMVFNQWGEKIFETNNFTAGWDGRYKGKVQPVGVYVYVVKLTLENGEQQTRKGVINLVR